MAGNYFIFFLSHTDSYAQVSNDKLHSSMFYTFNTITPEKEHSLLYNYNFYKKKLSKQPLIHR